MDKLQLIVSLLFTTVGVILIIFFTYISTKWISQKYKTMNSGKYIKILERIMLSQDKSLVLTQINDKVYLLGVTGQHIETICTMNLSELPEIPEDKSKADFGAILKEVMQNQLPFYRNNKKP